MTLRKTFFRLMNNAAFRKTMENVRKERDIKLVTNYHTTNFFTKNLLDLERTKTQIRMNKHVYLGLSILELSNAFVLL